MGTRPREESQSFSTIILALRAWVGGRAHLSGAKTSDDGAVCRATSCASFAVPPRPRKNQGGTGLLKPPPEVGHGASDNFVGPRIPPHQDAIHCLIGDRFSSLPVRQVEHVIPQIVADAHRLIHNAPTPALSLQLKRAIRTKSRSMTLRSMTTGGHMVPALPHRLPVKFKYSSVPSRLIGAGRPEETPRASRFLHGR